MYDMQYDARRIGIISDHEEQPLSATVEEDGVFCSMLRPGTYTFTVRNSATNALYLLCSKIMNGFEPE